MPDDRVVTIPMDWQVVDEARYEHILEAVRVVLAGPDAVQHLVDYYSRSGNYAGSTFVDLEPVSPWDITAADLLALTLLSVEAPPYSVRRLLEPSPDRDRVLHLLSEQALPRDAGLATASTEVLESMAALHETLRRCLSPAHVKTPNSWVKASKLCARKRPDLFPVRDNVVCAFLRLGHNYQVDWQVFRRVMQDRDIRDHIDDLASQAVARGAEIGDSSLRLRHLDVLLWMHARTLPRSSASR